MQFIGLARREWTRSEPCEQRPIVPWPNSILVHGAGGDCCEPAPAGIGGWAYSRRCRWHARRESQSLDDLSVIGAPQPSAPGNERVRNIKRQGSASERQAVGEQMGAEFRQEPIGTRAIGGGIDEPRKSRRKLHRAIMGRRNYSCHDRFLKKRVNAVFALQIIRRRGERRLPGSNIPSPLAHPPSADSPRRARRPARRDKAPTPSCHRRSP